MEMRKEQKIEFGQDSLQTCGVDPGRDLGVLRGGRKVMTPSWTWRIPLGEGQKAYYGAETFREEGTVWWHGQSFHQKVVFETGLEGWLDYASWTKAFIMV